MTPGCRLFSSVPMLFDSEKEKKQKGNEDRQKEGEHIRIDVFLSIIINDAGFYVFTACTSIHKTLELITSNVA